ncbi:hypothetical protein [Actinoplanes subglobosus]|uniref:Uncharacterized protein n=1 Tax=Actinoplanes subglobosus TaxID=1547892 RepID=A0ABV8J0I2_9ACTN
MAERKIDVLTLRWYEPATRSPDIASRWLEAARRHLPEAMPRRFGDVEPLRGRLDRDGEDGFRRGLAEADTLFALAGKPPVHAGTLSARRPRHFGPTVSHTLRVAVDPNDERVRRFALALAHPDMIYMSASMAGGYTLDDDELWGPPERPEEPFLAPLGDWLGLPPEPPSWCWFGPAYTRILCRISLASLSSSRQSRPRAGAVDSIGGLLWTGGPWVEERLQARLSEVDPARRHAPKMPGGLRRNLLQMLFSR